MAKTVHTGLTTLADQLTAKRANRYALQITSELSSLSVLTVTGDEQLNQPWHYTVTFTCPDKQLATEDLLQQPAALAFLAADEVPQVMQISSLDKPATTRTLYGIITEFSQLSVNQDEAHYQLRLQPRLARLALGQASVIYQNQSVVAVVEAVLRRHGFTGIDFRLELNDSYPAREFITQWQESDLCFIQRLLADIGIWLRFESHAEHHCDVIVLSDYEQGYDDRGQLRYQLPSGMVDRARDSIWDLQLHSKTVCQQVVVQDYNYRQAAGEMYALSNTQPKSTTTCGTDYRYGEHFKQQGDEYRPESGSWYAKIRHQAQISQQVILCGQCNDYHLAPGQRLIISGCPLATISEGIIILSTRSYGDRRESYQIQFTAIPYQVLNPYRPAPLPWPQIAGTLPARITSPANDTYGYLDTQGRYRVKFNFDLTIWRSGEESLWLRLAKPYAGERYGVHFPLIDGTEVAIAFSGGNPDRPYIAHAMHNSTHPDPVTLANKSRNVLRTPANNKLRLDDQRGQEHIKLATEYGKTQLNIGHLVNQQRENRGHGFELRTDEWGALRAGKGLYVTSETKPKASGKQLDMHAAVKQLESALEIARLLAQTAETAGIDSIDTTTQETLQRALNQLTQPAILLDSPAGVGVVTPQDIQLSAQSNIRLTADKNSYIAVMKKIAFTAGESINLFASKLGLKLFAAKGQVQIAAQSDALQLLAKKNIAITSTNEAIEIMADTALTLKCQGAYIKLAGGSIEIGCPGDIVYKAATVSFSGAATQSGSATSASAALGQTNLYSQQFRIIDEQTKAPRAYVAYRIEIEDGEAITGVSDENGYTERVYAMTQKTIKLVVEE